MIFYKATQRIDKETRSIKRVLACMLFVGVFFVLGYFLVFKVL